MLRVALGNVLVPETDWEALDRRCATAAHATRNGSSVARQFACPLTHASLDVLHSVESMSQTGQAHFCAYSSSHSIVLLNFALSSDAASGVGKLVNTFELEKAEVEDALGGDVMFMAFRAEPQQNTQDAVFILPTQDDALFSSGVPKLQLQFLQSLFHLANLALDNCSFRRQNS